MLRRNVDRDNQLTVLFGSKPIGCAQVNVTEKGLYTNPDLVKLTTSDYRFIALSDYLTEHKDDLGSDTGSSIVPEHKL